MTSIVDTSVKYFHSRMAGAPVLRGQPGSRTAVMDACLRDGWGVQVATSLVVSEGTATMVFPMDHAAQRGCVVLIAGASIAALNGEQKITFSGPNTLMFGTAAANGTATGTITCKMAPLGWDRPFSATNQAAYKSTDIAANGQFLRVVDTSSTVTRLTGYENMTAVSAGTGPFPTTTQYSGGSSWVKSAKAGATPVDWVIVGDGRSFYNETSPGMGAGAGFENDTTGPLWFFGDMVSLSGTLDPFCTALVGQPADYAADVATAGTTVLYSSDFSGGEPRAIFAPRDSSGLGASVVLESNLYVPFLQDSGFDRVSGRINLSKVVVSTNGVTSKRAEFPGLLLSKSANIEQLVPHLSLFRADVPEREYLALLCGLGGGDQTDLRLSALDITGPWR